MYKSKFTGPEVDDAIERVLNEETFNASGRYPEMSVGFSDDLVGRGESVPAEFSFRASGGKSIKDGTARIKRIKGNSVVWNQRVEKTYIDRDKVLENIDVIPQNHKFALIRSKAFGGCYYMPSIDVYDYVLTDGEYAKIFVQSHVVDAEYSRIYSTGESGYIQLIDLTKMFGAGNEPTTIEEYEARKPIVADEYAYNEGEVIHMTAEGVKSIGDNAWDEEWRQGFFVNDGLYVESPTQICSKNPIQVLPNESYCINQDFYYVWYYDKDMRYINLEVKYNKETFVTPSNAAYIHFNLEPPYGVTYKNDIIVTLVHSGWKQDTDAKYQPYWEDRLMFDKRIKDEFPDGMQKWDMVYNKNGKGYIVKGTGVVDLGVRASEITSSLCHNGEYRWRLWIEPNIKPIEANHIAANMMSVFDLGTADSTYLSKNGIAIDTENYLWIYDSRYVNQSDKDAMVELLQGKKLYYELAEPTIIEYDEPFNLDYRVADFGTEEIIAPQPSAPISADIIYQFNAVDMIREHELEITELQRIIATMQAQLTSLTSNNGGQ